MANLHKSIKQFSEKIDAMDEEKLEEELSLVLNSFIQKTRYGIHIIEAFEDSLLNTFTEEDVELESKIALQERKVKDKKYAALMRYRKDIIALREAGNTFRRIASFLNSNKLVGIKVSSSYVFNFIKEETAKGNKE